MLSCLFVLLTYPYSCSAGAGHLRRDHAAAPLEAPPGLRHQLQRRRGEAEGGRHQE